MARLILSGSEKEDRTYCRLAHTNESESDDSRASRKRSEEAFEERHTVVAHRITRRLRRASILSIAGYNPQYKQCRPR
jgi:hypothetical protein